MRTKIKKILALLINKLFKSYTSGLSEQVILNAIYSVRQQTSINKNKNVLHINATDIKGGAANVAYSLNTNLKDHGYTSAILVSRKYSDDDTVHKIKENSSLKQYILKRYEKENGISDMLSLSTYEIGSLDVFNNSSILHLHNLHPAYFSLPALPDLAVGRRMVWTLHDMYPFTGHCGNSLGCNNFTKFCGNCQNLHVYYPLKKDGSHKNVIHKKLIYDMLNITLIAPSKWMLDNVKKSILQEKEIRVIYNGVNEKTFINTPKSEARKKLGLPLDKFIILYASNGGNDNLWKGAKTVDSLKTHLRDSLIIKIGGGVKSRTGNVMETGYISDKTELADYYASADIFFYPTLADNCPLVVLEALSCGTPVVSYDTGGVSELVAHGITGYIAKYGDTDDLVKGTLLYKHNDILRQQSSIAARESVIRNFTESAMINQYAALYDELLSKQNGK